MFTYVVYVSKNSMLAVPEQLFKILKNEKEKFRHSSLQGLIIGSLREKYFRNKKKKLVED